MNSKTYKSIFLSCFTVFMICSCNSDITSPVNSFKGDLYLGDNKETINKGDFIPVGKTNDKNFCIQTCIKKYNTNVIAWDINTQLCSCNSSLVNVPAPY